MIKVVPKTNNQIKNMPLNNLRIRLSTMTNRKMLIYLRVIVVKIIIITTLRNITLFLVRQQQRNLRLLSSENKKLVHKTSSK